MKSKHMKRLKFNSCWSHLWVSGEVDLLNTVPLWHVMLQMQMQIRLWSFGIVYQILNQISIHLRMLWIICFSLVFMFLLWQHSSVTTSPIDTKICMVVLWFMIYWSTDLLIYDLPFFDKKKKLVRPATRPCIIKSYHTRFGGNRTKIWLLKFIRRTWNVVVFEMQIWELHFYFADAFQ